MWRPENWQELVWNEIKRQLDMGVKETYTDEMEYYINVGADIMCKAIMKTRPSEEEIRIRIVDCLHGDDTRGFLKWLKDKHLVKEVENGNSNKK